MLQLAILDIQGIAAVDAALRNQHALVAFVELDIGRDAVGAVHDIGRGIDRDFLSAGIEGIAAAIGGDLRSLVGETLLATAVHGQDIVFARFHIPLADHLNQLRPHFGAHVAPFREPGLERAKLRLQVLVRQVVIFGEVFGDLVQFPGMGIEIGQHGGGNRHAKGFSRFFE